MTLEHAPNVFAGLAHEKWRGGFVVGQFGQYRQFPDIAGEV
jgi:hypothetical protein